jgi:RNA polymerase sigma-70 factor (ECF subfamily)
MVSAVLYARPSVLRRFRLSKSRDCLLVQSWEDPEAFAAFFETYSDRVLGFLARRVLDPEVAFDLMSETFATALECSRQFRGATTEEEQGWLFAIARRELSQYWRAGKVERGALHRLSVTVPVLSDPEFERIEELAGLAPLIATLPEALAALPSDQRRAIELRVVEERSYPDVAATLDVAEAAARARVSRGLRALARTMTTSPTDELTRDTA